MENDPSLTPPSKIWNFPYVLSFFFESFPYKPYMLVCTGTAVQKDFSQNRLSWTVMDCYGLSWTGFSIYWSVSNIFSYGQTFSMNQSILIGQTVSQGQIIISSSQTAMAKSRDPSDDLKRIQWEIKKERRFCCWQFYEYKCYIFCLNMFFTRGNDWYIHNLLWFLIKWRI